MQPIADIFLQQDYSVVILALHGAVSTYVQLALSLDFIFYHATEIQSRHTKPMKYLISHVAILSVNLDVIYYLVRHSV
jgi:hypothetical protein